MTGPTFVSFWAWGLAIAAAAFAAIDVTAVAVMLIVRMAHLWPNPRANDRLKKPREDN